MKHKKVALIGAGSVKCAATLGVLRVLRQAGIEPDMVVGCSGGALYATAVSYTATINTRNCFCPACGNSSEKGMTS